MQPGRRCFEPSTAHKGPLCGPFAAKKLGVAAFGPSVLLAAREVAPSGSIPLTHTLPPPPLSLRLRDQEQDHQHEADAEQREVREREDCSERSQHERTGPEENGDDSAQESSGG